MYAASIDLQQPLAWLVPQVLSPQECVAHIERLERLGPEKATIDLGPKAMIREEIRNNSRVTVDDEPMASLLFERLRARLPSTLMGMKVTGANPRLRYYRYHPGEYFALHHDGSYVKGPRERSLLTLMVYLNEDFEGGATAFPELQQTFVPRTGSALLFQHMLLHEGCKVTRGTKYAIRSDVMYRAP